MTGNIDHVVDAAHNPEITVPVFACAIAGKVHAFDLRPVLLAVAFIVAIDRAQHPGPGPGDNEITAFIGSD